MKIHKEVVIKTKPQFNAELIFYLQQIGFDSFWEKSDNELVTSIEKNNFDLIKLQNTINNFPESLSFKVTDLKEKNWNAIWENSYKPFTIDNMVIIRAPFHKKEKKYKYQIEITPKMAFGTGHHATTEQVMRLQLENDFKNKKVLDFGCGTAILAILAELMGAKNVLAIDNDTNAIKMAKENIKNNSNKKILAIKASIEEIKNEKFDVILANINRNTIIEAAKELEKKLKKNGKLIISGFIPKDKDIIFDKLKKYNFEPIKIIEKNNWIAATLNLK